MFPSVKIKQKYATSGNIIFASKQITIYTIYTKIQEKRNGHMKKLILKTILGNIKPGNNIFKKSVWSFNKLHHSETGFMSQNHN